MKNASEVKPNYAPVYAAAMYPDLCQIFINHGYALAVHGSLARDFDLIAIPWVENPSPQETVLAEMKKKFSIEFIGEPETRCHGRVVRTLSIGFGQCAIDMCFMPTIKA